MRNPVSLTTRLTWMFSAVAAVVFLSFGWMIGNSLQDHFISEDNKEIQVIIRAVQQSLAKLHVNTDLQRLKQRFDDILVGHHGAQLRVIDRNDHIIYSSKKLDLTSIPTPVEKTPFEHKTQFWNDDKHSYRVLRHKITTKNQQTYRVTIAVTTDFHLHFLTSFRHTLWLMVLSGILIMALMGWIAVRQGHRPLRDIVNQMSQISTDKLNTRLTPETMPSELTELATSFNELLQRMEEAFSRLSNFSADIAHELRTPVTNLMTQTQVALSQSRSAGEYEEILYSNIEEYERMAQMISDMLFLAKADNQLESPNVEDIKLVDEIKNLFDYYSAWAEERKVNLSISGKAKLKGDRLMLRRALSNLISNAIRHTPTNKVVNVRFETNQNSVIIRVQNPGIPIPPAHICKIFDRFYRVDPSRQRGVEGAGLGLAIVKSIVDAHNGKIDAISDDNYTEFRMVFPKN